MKGYCLIRYICNTEDHYIAECELIDEEIVVTEPIVTDYMIVSNFLPTQEAALKASEVILNFTYGRNK